MFTEIADARCAEKWWKDERIKKRFARWGGGAGRYAAEAGKALLRYIGKADNYNLGFVAKRFNVSIDELRKLSYWAYNDIPAPLEAWAGALLIAGVPPKAIMENFVDYRKRPDFHGSFYEKCLSWEQPH